MCITLMAPSIITFFTPYFFLGDPFFFLGFFLLVVINFFKLNQSLLKNFFIFSFSYLSYVLVELLYEPCLSYFYNVLAYLLTLSSILFSSITFTTSSPKAIFTSPYAGPLCSPSLLKFLSV